MHSCTFHNSLLTLLWVVAKLSQHIVSNNCGGGAFIEGTPGAAAVSFMPQVEQKGTAREEVQPQLMQKSGNAQIRSITNSFILVLLGQTEHLDI